MPRQARLDAPGTLHHVIVRGIERGKIVADRQDRAAFVARMGDLAAATQTSIYAWALLPNHAHLLLRSGPQGLPKFMRRLLTGYAIRYNRRHRRAGHLFQNRYKSIVCEEDPYFRELVRYIHLNPVRAKLVTDLAQRKRVSKVRAQIAMELVTGLCLPLADVARQVGVSTSGISKVLRRAAK